MHLYFSKVNVDLEHFKFKNSLDFLIFGSVLYNKIDHIEILDFGWYNFSWELTV